jgi:hypothetical protein
MPIDAERFLARIKCDSHEPAAAVVPRAQQPEPTREAPAAISEEMCDDRSALGAKLEATTNKSLDKANEILDLPLDPGRQHYPAELRARTALINTAMTTQARVAEAQRFDRLPELLRIIAMEEAKLPSLASEHVSPEEEAHLRRLIAQVRSEREGEPDG